MALHGYENLSPMQRMADALRSRGSIDSEQYRTFEDQPYAQPVNAPTSLPSTDAGPTLPEQAAQRAKDVYGRQQGERQRRTKVTIESDDGTPVRVPGGIEIGDRSLPDMGKKLPDTGDLDSIEKMLERDSGVIPMPTAPPYMLPAPTRPSNTPAPIQPPYMLPPNREEMSKALARRYVQAAMRGDSATAGRIFAILQQLNGVSPSNPTAPNPPGVPFGMPNMLFANAFRR